MPPRFVPWLKDNSAANSLATTRISGQSEIRPSVCEPTGYGKRQGPVRIGGKTPWRVAGEKASPAAVRDAGFGRGRQHRAPPQDPHTLLYPGFSPPPQRPNHPSFF